MSDELARERRTRKPRLAALAATVAVSLVVISGCSAMSGASDEDLTPRSRSVGDSTLDCGKDPGPPPKSVKATRTAALGAPEEEAINPMKWIADEVGLDLFDDSAGAGFGWMFKLLVGKQSGTDPKIDQKITDTQAKVDGVSKQVYDLCSSLDNRLDELDSRVDLKAYQQVAGGLKTGALSKLQSYQKKYSDVQEEFKGSHDSTWTWQNDGLITGDMWEIRDGIVGDVIVPLDNAMRSSNDADGMLGMYADVLADAFGYRPVPTQTVKSGTRVLPAEYVNAAYAQYNYYAGAMVQALIMYADAINVQFEYNGKTQPAAPGTGRDRSNDVNDDLDAWGAVMWGGVRTSGQKGDWVSHDLGAVPDGTVADLRVQGKPELWTAQPVALSGDPGYTHQTSPSTPADGTPPPYCGTVSTFCASRTYDGNGTVLTTSLVRPTPGPVAALVHRQAPFGIDDWRVPTKADWAGLQAGATTDGLTAWGKKIELPQFSGQTATSQITGTAVAHAVIGPLLVDLSDKDTTSFGVLAGLPADKTLTQHTYTATSGSALAGALYLVRDIPTGAVSKSHPTPKHSTPRH